MNMNKSNSEQFSKLLSPIDGESIKLWEESTHTWITMFKEYESPFVETNEWKNDLYCLVRIGFNNEESNNLKSLRYDISIQSKYINRNHFLIDGNKNDSTFPMKNSLGQFMKSNIPFNLSSSNKSKIIFDLKKNLFYMNKKKYTLREFIDELYNIHINSTSLWDKIRYHYSSIFLSYIFDYVIYYFCYIFLHKLIIWWKKIKDEEYFQLFLLNGTKVTLEEDKLKIDETNLEVQLPLFGWKIKVNKNWIFWWIVILWWYSLFHFNSYEKNWGFELIKLFVFYKDNEVISWILIIIWIFLFSFTFNKILPKITIGIINTTIRLRKGILNKFYYKGFNYDSWNNPYN